MHIKHLEEWHIVGTKLLFLFFLSDGKLDVNLNCVPEEHAEAETGISQKDCEPKGSVEGEKESLQSAAGLEDLQDVPAGPQVSEE